MAFASETAQQKPRIVRPNFDRAPFADSIFDDLGDEVLVSHVEATVGPRVTDVVHERDDEIVEPLHEALVPRLIGDESHQRRPVEGEDRSA